MVLAISFLSAAEPCPTVDTTNIWTNSSTAGGRYIAGSVVRVPGTLRVKSPDTKRKPLSCMCRNTGGTYLITAGLDPFVRISVKARRWNPTSLPYQTQQQQPTTAPLPARQSTYQSVFESNNFEGGARGGYCWPLAEGWCCWYLRKDSKGRAAWGGIKKYARELFERPGAPFQRKVRLPDACRGEGRPTVRLHDVIPAPWPIPAVENNPPPTAAAGHRVPPQALIRPGCQKGRMPELRGHCPTTAPAVCGGRGQAVECKNERWLTVKGSWFFLRFSIPISVLIYMFVFAYV